MVHPHSVAFLHRHGIGAVVGLGLLEVDVSYDDIVCAYAEDAYAVHHKAVRAYEAEVAHVLDVEPGMCLGEVPAVIGLESAAEPYCHGAVVPLLLALGTGEEPRLQGLAVVEVKNLSAFTTGHVLGIAAELVHRYGANCGRRGTLQLITFSGEGFVRIDGRRRLKGVLVDGYGHVENATHKKYLTHAGFKRIVGLYFIHEGDLLQALHLIDTHEFYPVSSWNAPYFHVGPDPDVQSLSFLWHFYGFRSQNLDLFFVLFFRFRLIASHDCRQSSSKSQYYEFELHL